MKEVLLIDGKHVCYRAHFTHSNLSSYKQPTSIIYGLPSILLSIQRKLRIPMIIVWDGNGETWRHTILKNRPRTYKGNRKRTDHHEIMNQQIPIAQEFLSILGVWQFTIPNLEADDLIGILSSYLTEELNNDRVIIYSGDRDFFQLISDKVKVWYPKGGQTKPKFITPKYVKEEWDVDIKDFVKYKALCGDHSDNIESVKPGIGKVTAAKLVNAGLDPSKDWEQLSIGVKSQFAQTFESLWKKARENYKLCKIIRKSNHRYLSKETINIIEACLYQIKLYGVNRMNYKSMKTFRKVIDYCVTYELDEILEKRNEFWYWL